MLSKALREYDTVSAEPTTCRSSRRPLREGREPRWHRRAPVPLDPPAVGRLRLQLCRVASLYAGDPPSPEAWRGVISRVQQHARRRDEIVAVLRRSAGTRAARRRAARAAVAQLADPGRLRFVTGQQAGAFGGPMYTLLKAITALQLARRSPREQQVPVVADLLGRRRGSRLGGDAELYGARRRVPAAHRHAGRPGGRGRAPRCARSPRPPASSRPSTSSRPSSRRPIHRVARPTSAPPGRRASAWRERSRRWLESVLGPSRPRRFRVRRSGGKAARRRRVRARASPSPGTHRSARDRGRRGARGARPCTAGRAAARQLSLFHLDGGRPADPPPGRSASSSANTTFAERAAQRCAERRRRASARTSCCGRSCRTRCSRRSATWRVRASSPISVSCGGVYQRVRRADAADVPARDCDAASIRGRDGSCRKTVDLRGAAAARTNRR